MRTALANALAGKFTEIRKAFHFVDVDNSGTVDAKEIKRALHLFNIELPADQLMALMAECDHDGDGQVTYDEFVDALARDTVAPAAMGKRGMLSKDAMGVDAYAALDEQLKGRKVKHAYANESL